MSRPATRTLGLIVVLLALVALGVTAYSTLGPKATDFAGGAQVALTAYHDEDPSGVPAALKTSDLLARGEYLTRAGDCMVCHTAQGGSAFAGGRAFRLPFGTLYSTNITPDHDTGIGAYTDAEFLEAVRRGIGRGHRYLYPAMPYASYTYLTDADALSIKAYLFSLTPVHAPAPANSLIFPFDQRPLMGVWAMLFNPNQRFHPHTDHSAQWNRGAYLTEALGHCGECHTPRNLFFALNHRQKFAGSVQAGWRAFNITPDKNSGVGSWSDDDLAQYLSRGHAPGRGTAAGPMGEAVLESLAFLKPDDISAMVVYLRSVSALASNDLPATRSTPGGDAPSDSAMASVDPHGRTVYAGACVGCHGWSGVSSGISEATLTGTRAVNDPTAVNVAQIILQGGPGHEPGDPRNMPAFGATYSDEEIAGVANFVTARFGAQPSMLSAADVAKFRTQQ
jgi:mono/diheme cytochrome c family protein